MISGVYQMGWFNLNGPQLAGCYWLLPVPLDSKNRLNRFKKYVAFFWVASVRSIRLGNEPSMIN